MKVKEYLTLKAGGVLHRPATSKDVIKDNTPVDEISNLLYSLDERGRLDLSLGRFMSQKERPEIREYIQSHIMRSSSFPQSNCYDADVCLENITPFCMQYGLERNTIANQVLDKIKSFVEPNNKDN